MNQSMQNDLRVINLDLDKLGDVIFNYIGPCFNLDTIIHAELKIYGKEKDSLYILMKNGTKCMDAFLSVIQPNGILTYSSGGEPKSDTDIAKGLRTMVLLVCYILLRGEYPNESSNVPSLLIGFGVNPATFPKECASICSIALSRIPVGWVRRVDLLQLPLKLRNRLALGMPGYRLINVLRSTDPDSPEDIYHIFIKWVRDNFVGLHWDVVTFTRSDSFLKNYPNFSKNLLSFMKGAYSDETLEKLVKLKFIHQKPELDTRYDSWKHWSTNPVEFKSPVTLFKKEEIEPSISKDEDQ